MINIGIYGYGNLGRGVLDAVAAAPDMRLVAIFTRRDPALLQIDIDKHVGNLSRSVLHGAKNSTENSAENSTVNLTENSTHSGKNPPKIIVETTQKIPDYKGKIDVMILCGGSARDLPVQTPQIAGLFNFVDSFDNHSQIAQHFAAVNQVALAAGTVGAVSVGWDPGLFSLFRLLGRAVLPFGKDYTFWGKGVSQGHSDAIRRISGVKHAVQYTIPVSGAVDAAKSGLPDLSPMQMHTRECFVVADDGADLQRITNEILTMPNYFLGYRTTVNFISESEFFAYHTSMPHGGTVLRAGTTGGQAQTMQLNLQLSSNPSFTGSVLTAYARAVFALSRRGLTGAHTVFDIPPSYLMGEDVQSLYRTLL